MSPAEAEPWRRCRWIRLEEMGEAMPRFVRAGSSPLTGDTNVTILQKQSLKELHYSCLFHSWFVFISKTKAAGCFSSEWSVTSSGTGSRLTTNCVVGGFGFHE